MNMHSHDQQGDRSEERSRGPYRHGRRHWGLKILGVLAAVTVIGTCVGWIVTMLWNWLMPPLFGLGVITFWQALGLFVLGRILVGGMRGFGRHGRHGHRHHQRMHERWERMTAEERESFSRGLKRHCPWGNSANAAARPAAEASENP